MADDKPKKKGASSLYDNSDMEDSRAKAKADERKGEEHAEAKKMAGEMEAEADESAGEKVAKGKEKSPHDIFMEGLKAIRQRHEKERRDHHEGHREALRSMGSRHDKEFSDHFSLHFGADGGTDKGGGEKMDAGAEE